MFHIVPTCPPSSCFSLLLLGSPSLFFLCPTIVSLTPLPSSPRPLSSTLPLSSSFSFFPSPLASFFLRTLLHWSFLRISFLICLFVYFSDRLYVSIYPKLNLNSGLSYLRLPSSGVINGMCFYKNVISSLYAFRKSHIALWGSLLSI